MKRIRKPLAACVMLLALLALTGCTTGAGTDSDYECEWITQLRPMYIGKTLTFLPYQTCIPIHKEKKT